MDKGWGDREIPFPEQCALLHSEMSEALESWRNNEPNIWMDGDKPCGIQSEFADILIRLCHYASLNGFDLEAAVILKLDYNATRQHRHGGKLA
jgi:NTP pyrophosphatase (non-canonical NTP hydrolase)